MRIEACKKKHHFLSVSFQKLEGTKGTTRVPQWHQYHGFGVLSIQHSSPPWHLLLVMPCLEVPVVCQIQVVTHQQFEVYAVAVYDG